MITINKAKFGPAFQRNAKIVQQAVEAIGQDQDAVSLFQKDLDANGVAKVKAADGNEYTITKEMASISHQTKKISGIFRLLIYSS